MKALVIGALLGLGALLGVAQAQPAPIRVHIECEDSGRTKACPAFLLGILDANKVLLDAPRAAADVVVYVSANEIALVDRLHLRFVGTVAGAPPVIEIDVDVDSRAVDDVQRAQLEPAFLRGLALYVAARHPSAVTVALSTPDALAKVDPDTTPWGVALSVGASGNRTERYRSLNGYSELELTRVTRRSRGIANVSANGGLNRQPPLMLEDGTTVSLDTEQWSLGALAGAAWLYDACWSFGGITRLGSYDPKAQYRYQSSTRVGVEWDKYPVDDPRGNRLAVLYTAGYQVERYNLRNVIGETFAHYPTHQLLASGSVRKDKVSFGLSLSAGGELLHPKRRHHVSASPYIELQLGDHVDLHVSFSITKRELPGPDETRIDPSDYELLSRLSYAEPLSMNGSLNLTIHWDRTNGARNDRFEDI